MVNTKQDTCRYIYVPSYFKTMLENNHHAFMSSVREYCRELVHPEYHDEFAKLLDYSYIEEQIAAHGSLKMTYRIRDGSRVHLKITAVPYRKMVQAYETHVKENLESYRAKYSDMDDGTYQAAILEDRLAFYQAYTETVTTEVDMDLVYQEDRWIISHCEGLSNALLGESDV